jgi:NAD-dependent SIR2 family protein deacetylase
VLPPIDDCPLARAARVLVRAEALLITAGAGMGVDSGLPDFRGDTTATASTSTALARLVGP